MNTERLIHNIPQCSTIDLSASSIWKTIESHHDRWVKLSCKNTSMCLSYVPFTLVIRLINCWDFIQIWYDNKMLSSQWDNDNQHFVYIIVSCFLLWIITCQGFLFSCSCMNRCTCFNCQVRNVHGLSSTDVRKRRRATACCEKSKFAISSGWLKNGSVGHPGDIITLSSLIRMRYQLQLSHADAIWWHDMSSGWHTAVSISHPVEVLPIVKSSGWDTENS